MKNPQQYIDQLEYDVHSWKVGEARKHFLDAERYTTTRWVPTQWQVYEVIEHEVLFNCNAFHLVQPRACLDTPNSRVAMNEAWRRVGVMDPWDVDLRFFECLHCKQYSKTQFCSHCVAVILDAVCNTSFACVIA